MNPISDTVRAIYLSSLITFMIELVTKERKIK